MKIKLLSSIIAGLILVTFFALATAVLIFDYLFGGDVIAGIYAAGFESFESTVMFIVIEIVATIVCSLLWLITLGPMAREKEALEKSRDAQYAVVRQAHIETEQELVSREEEIESWQAKVAQLERDNTSDQTPENVAAALADVEEMMASVERSATILDEAGEKAAEMMHDASAAVGMTADDITAQMNRLTALVAKALGAMQGEKEASEEITSAAGEGEEPDALIFVEDPLEEDDRVEILVLLRGLSKRREDEELDTYEGEIVDALESFTAEFKKNRITPYGYAVALWCLGLALQKTHKENASEEGGELQDLVARIVPRLHGM